jgi:4'-phosphopantetheinyl transferase EntD
VIEEILPDSVASAEAFDDPPGVILFPEEEMALGGSVEKRRREFATARLCARRALAQLGQPPEAVPHGPRGEPQWPAGVVGSITHCAGYRAAAVAHASQVAALGIDAEPNRALPDEVLRAISTAEERARLRELASADSKVCWDRLLFSAKEAAYKAWFPLAGRLLGFEDANVVINPVEARFFARLLVPEPMLAAGRLRNLTGRWLARRGLVLTAIALLTVDGWGSGGARAVATPT